MEAWESLNLSHVCWQPGFGLQKPDLERQTLACRFPWPFQQRHKLQNCFGILWIRKCGPCLQFPLMAIKKGSENANTRKQKLLKINLILEAEVEDGQQVYVSGSVTSLGAWNPELAIAMSPCENETNLWQAEIQVPRGTTFDYNYFVIGGKILLEEIIWKPGPTLCLSIPSAGRLPKKKVVLQDSWLKIASKNLPVVSCGNWREDSGSPSQPNGFVGLESSCAVDLPASHSDINTGQLSGQILNTKADAGLAICCDASTALLIPVIDTQASIEQDGSKSKLLPKGVLQRKIPDVSRQCKNVDGQKKLYQPIEEPWLPGSFILIKEKTESQDSTLVIELDKGVAVAETEECLPKELKSENGEKSLESQTKQEGVGMVPQKKDVVTEIIINSSVCTIQRIAVLEDGKPVEILLEQEEEGTKVQAGNIYLGVVTQLLPKMDAAFVDIGSASKALLNIKKGMAPFAFPSLDLIGKDSQFNGDLANNSGGVESSSRDEEELHELLESAVQEDEMPVIYADAVDGEEVIGEALEGPDNLVEVNNYGIDINNVSNANIEDGDYLHENGHEMEETSDEQYANRDHSTTKGKGSNTQFQNSYLSTSGSPSVDFAQTLKKQNRIREGTKIIVQVRKEELRNKGPQITANPSLASRFWVLLPRSNRVGVSQSIKGNERKRLKEIAKMLQQQGFGLTLRTAADGHSYEELQKDLTGLMETWKDIVEHAKAAVIAAEKGVEGAVPVLLHRAMPRGQTRSVVQDYFNEKVQRMVVDSLHTYNEVTAYLQEFAPSLVNRVELYKGKNPIFDEFGVETEIDNLLRKRVDLPDGGYLVIEETEALVSIDVNGGSGMLGREMSREEANIKVNLAAARQIARELRLRDIGGIIVVDFIDMNEDKHKRIVHEEIKKAAERDRSSIKFSELSELGLMEIARKRVRNSLTCMISEPCSCCDGNGRVEALHTIFSKIEHAILRFLARKVQTANAKEKKFWPRIFLWVDPAMFDYLTSGEKTRVALLSSSLKVWIVLKIKREFERGQFEVIKFVPKSIIDKKLQAAIARTNSKRTRSNGARQKSKRIANQKKVA